MNIIIILFLISGIINILYINKLKMYTAKKLYSFTLFIMLLLFSFISDSLVIRFIIKLFTPFSVYEFVSSALNNNDYVFTFLLIVSIVTMLQLLISIIIINNKIILYKYKKTNIKEDICYKQIINIFTKERKENTIQINKVYIDLCKMLN